jgi:hypothetical protein
MLVISYSRSSGNVVGKQAGTVQDALQKALERIERHVPEEWEKGKNQFRRLAVPNMQADDLEDIGSSSARFTMKSSSRKAVQPGYPLMSNFVVPPCSFILINCR